MAPEDLRNEVLAVSNTSDVDVIFIHEDRACVPYLQSLCDFHLYFRPVTL